MAGIKKSGTKPYSPGTNLEDIVVYYEDPYSEIAKLSKLEPHLQSSSIMSNTMDSIYRRSTQVAKSAHWYYLFLYLDNVRPIRQHSLDGNK